MKTELVKLRCAISGVWWRLALVVEAGSTSVLLEEQCVEVALTFRVPSLAKGSDAEWFTHADLTRLGGNRLLDTFGIQRLADGGIYTIDLRTLNRILRAQMDLRGHPTGIVEATASGPIKVGEMVVEAKGGNGGPGGNGGSGGAVFVSNTGWVGSSGGGHGVGAAVSVRQPMARDKAIALARRFAAKNATEYPHKAHSYLPKTPLEAVDWMPHSWVVDAIVEASK